MKKILVSYANEQYLKSQTILTDTAVKIGNVDDAIPYTDSWLKTTEYYEFHKHILDQPRGCGFWIWKPYIILEAMKSLEDGDIVLYSDAGVSVINDLTPLFNLAAKKGVVVFKIGGGHQNKTWTKRDCFILTDCDEQKYWDSIQTTGSYHLWVKNEKNIQFITEYQHLLCDENIVTDKPNVCGKENFPEFKDHRHDQSVLSLMSIKYELERFRDPSQYGVYEKNIFTNSEYEQLFNHHRNNIKH